MSYRKTIFAEGEYYHIYNRGNSKREIFHDQQDYLYFIDLLSIMNTESRKTVRSSQDIPSKTGEKSRQSLSLDEDIISIGAYCLMPNHFHILIKQEKQDGISKYMQKLSTAYVMYYNKKYVRTGSLFEGKFKSKHAGEDTYLKYLFSYIHLNPLKLINKDWKQNLKSVSKGAIQFLSTYNYSSFNEYYNDSYMIVNKMSFPNYFSTKAAFIKDIGFWFTDKNYTE